MRKYIIAGVFIIICFSVTIIRSQELGFLGDFEVDGIIKSLQQFVLTDEAATSTPATGDTSIWAADGKLYFENEAGVRSDLTAGAAGGDVDQNLWNTIAGDTGSEAATSTTSTLTFIGGTNITTTVGTNTVTIDSSAGGSGDVTKVGTPVDNEMGVWTGDGTLEGDTNFQWDGSAATITGGLNVNLPADDSIIIDGSTNNRTIDTGAIQIEQMPAIENTRALTINLDINSQATTHAQVTNIVATGLAPGETATAYDTNVDRSTSTGGIVRGYEMSISGAGSAMGHLMHADPGVVPLSHLSGTFINVEQAWDENGGFTDVTTAFNSTSTDVTLFNANADMVHIGMASAFNAIEVNLATFAGGAGIKPVFEYSSGGGTPVWTVFTPQDETQGFRQSGIINWDIDDLVTPTWAAATINSVSKLYIRITRTQASIPTDPIEDTIQITTTTNFFWNENAKIFAGSITTGVSSNTITSEGVSETSQMTSHINDAFPETIENTLMRHSDTAGSGASLYGIRSRGTHVAATIVQDNDVIFQIRAEGHDGTDFNDVASIRAEIDGDVGGENDTPGRWVFETTTDGTNTLVEAMRINSSQQVIISATNGALVIPQGTSPTVDAAGEIAVDTTDDQFVYYGSAKRVLSSSIPRSAVIENLKAADDGLALGMINEAITITSIGVHCDGTCTTPADIALSDRAGNAMTHTTPTVSTGTDNTTFVAVTSGNSLAAGEGLEFSVTNAVSPETDTYTISFTYTLDAQ